MKKIFFGVVLIAVAFFVVRQRWSRIQPGEFKNYNVLLITLDTTRADHLPVYGYKAVATPNLEHLARESYIFDDAISHVPLTLPAHASILTGMLPISHGIRDNAGSVLPQEIVTLPEILKTNGYSTSAFVSAVVLDARWQLNQGFDLYYDAFPVDPGRQLTPEDAQRSAGETVKEAASWLKIHAGKSFFSWVHLYDPHEPYDPPEPFKSKYSSNLYDGEIAYMDEAIGTLLDSVSAIKDKTIVIVTADHGEGLGQHQEDTHGMFIYDTTQRVPLLIRLPEKKQGYRVAPLARHIDLLPTILELLGIRTDAEPEGSSLVEVMNGRDASGRAAYIESMYSELHYGWSPLKGIVSGRYKYIDAPRAELYDRIQDPGETRNLIASQKDTAEKLKKQLDPFAGRRSHTPSPQPVDQETEEMLRALGYVGTGSNRTSANANIDPKDRIHIARDVQTASKHAQANRYKDALNLVLPIVKEDPSIADAHFIAGVSFLGLLNFEGAISEFSEALAIRPGHTLSLYNLGYAYELQGDVEAAMQCFRRVLKQEPAHLQANLKLGQLYYRKKQPDAARPFFLAAIDRYKRDLDSARDGSAKSSLHASIGEAYFGSGDLAEAERHIQAAIALTPERSNLHYNLGSLYEVRGDSNAAMRAYLREIELNSENYKAYNNLGLLYRSSGQLEKAAACFERIVELRPDDGRGYLQLASIYEQMGRVQEAGELLKNFERKTDSRH